MEINKWAKLEVQEELETLKKNETEMQALKNTMTTLKYFKESFNIILDQVEESTSSKTGISQLDSLLSSHFC